MKFFKTIFLLIISLHCSLNIYGASNQENFKNKAPVNNELIEFQMPETIREVLPNGLTVIILEDHRAPAIYMEFRIIGAGAIYEPKELPGLASLTAAMLIEGAQGKNSAQIAQELEILGASFSASAGFGSMATSVESFGLSDNFEDWLDLTLSLLLNPSFPEESLDILKSRTAAGIQDQRTDTDFLAQEQFEKSIYGDHPYGVNSMTMESLATITPSTLATWHQKRYAPQNTILGIAGNVRAKSVLRLLRRKLASWPKTDFSAPRTIESPTPQTQGHVYLIDRPGSVQSNVRVGNLGIDRADPDFETMLVTHQAFGMGMNSRLFQNIREEKSYAYSVGSTFQAPLTNKGHWMTYAETRTETTAATLDEFNAELRRLSDEPMTDQELNDAKRSLIAGFALTLESSAALLDMAMKTEIRQLPKDYWDNYPERINAVTPQDIQGFAQEYMNPDSAQIVVVGDGATLAPQLEKFGPVSIFDTNGQPITTPSPVPVPSN